MSTRVTQGAVALAALMLAMPAAAQQAQASDPHHPAGVAPAAGSSAAQAAPAAPAPTTPAPATPGGMGMMGMMGGQGSMGMMGMMGGDGRQPGMPMMRHHGQYATPMNVIINVGPDIRLDVEGPGGTGGMRRPGMMGGAMPGMMGGPGMAGAPPMAGPLHEMLAERVEGGLAFLRAELGIRPDQEAAWNGFASRIREAAARYRAARDQIPAGGAGLEPRLAAQDARLSAELERVRACREAAAVLLPSLDEAQRRTADALAWLVVPGSGPGMMTGMMAGGMGGPAR